MSLILVPAGRAWQEFLSWWRDEPVKPAFTEHGLFLADSTLGALLAGACIYPTNGPYALVEHMACNPRLDAASKHDAVRCLIDHAGIYAAGTGKILITQAVGGVCQMLERFGWQANRATGYVLQPFIPIQATAPEQAGGPGLSEAAGEAEPPQPAVVAEPKKPVKRGKKA